MLEKNRTAWSMFRAYREQYGRLVNTYCLAKQHNPFSSFYQLTAAIWRMGVLADIWERLALAGQKKNEENK